MREATCGKELCERGQSGDAGSKSGGGEQVTARDLQGHGDNRRLVDGIDGKG
jgi:hypothetical protein